MKNLLSALLISSTFMLHAQPDIFSTPGTTTWTVPPCITSITVYIIGAGGGGGASTSRAEENFGDYSEACSQGGGGGGGGFTQRTYAVTPGDVYTVTVGAGGLMGIATSSTNAANSSQNDGGDGGSSSFSGPATLAPGILIAYGGLRGGGAKSYNDSWGPYHVGYNGTGGAGGSAANGTLMYNGGNGSTGRHSSSCYDASGGGGGAAGPSGNGGNASSPNSCSIRNGGTGGGAPAGVGANGRILDTYGWCRFFTGNNGVIVGGGASGAMIHNNSEECSGNTATRNGGTGARGEVQIHYTCPLPIELGTFDLSCQEDDVLLEWTTISENNNDYFVIEKAGVDGIYKEIGTVEGVGNSINEIKYDFYDRDNNNEKSYYRLYQVDFDGTESNVAVRALNCSNKEINIYPNPFKDELIVELGDLVRNINAAIEIIDAQGKMVLSKMVLKNESFSKISTERLNSGLYIVRIYSDNMVYTERIVKN
ncbi:MAG: T9SS type A sorting domain-containing protein [Fluviicola sp.]|nr:T9SS type A sorting domain-containing protein [Fluviicola sp.]